jgi:hypothetical protein
MRSFKFILLIKFTIFFICNALYAQNDNTFYLNNTELIPSDSNKLILSISNINFIKNNEYFNEIEQGFTWIGFFIQPKLIYYPTSSTKIIGGMHLLKYSGKDNFTKVLPVFSFSYKPYNSITIIIGSLTGTINHQLIEPLYKFEHYYFDNIENGIQFLINTKYVKSDSWLHWESFNLPDEQTKEQFSFGTNLNLFITNPESKNVFYFPLQVFLFHNGGQVENATIQTIENSATGFAFEHFFNNIFLKSLGTKNYFCTYNDLSNIFHYKYSQGWGESSNIFLNTKYFYLMFGYWHSKYFIAPEGEPLFLNNSRIYDYYYEAYRNLITSKIQIERTIAKGINIGLRFESYYEYAKKDFDFSYGLNLIFNRDFFIKKIK